MLMRNIFETLIIMYATMIVINKYNNSSRFWNFTQTYDC